MAAWERTDRGRVINGIPVVRHTIAFGRVVITLGRSNCTAYHGVWMMTCWPWAEGMPLQANGEDESAARKEAIEWLKAKVAELATQIKWSNA